MMRKMYTLLLVACFSTSLFAKKVLVDSKNGLNEIVGRYVGAGRVSIVVDNTVTYKDQASVKLQPISQVFNKNTEKFHFGAAIVMGGKNNGYTSRNALEVEQNKTYKCTFYLKGNITDLSIFIQGWKVNEHGSKGRRHIGSTIYEGGNVCKTVNAADKWTKYEIVSNKIVDCDRLVFMIRYSNITKEEDKALAGKHIYVANITIVEEAVAPLPKFIGFDGFEKGIPKRWQLLGKGKFSIYKFHYKYGTQSLRWDFKAGDIIKVEHKIGEFAKRGGYRNIGFPAFCMWLYSKQALKGKCLQLEFRTDNKVDAHVNIPLNFKYWQPCFFQYTPAWRNQNRFLQGEVRASTNNILLKAPKDAEGNLLIDLVVYKGYADGRLEALPPREPYKLSSIDEKQLPVADELTEEDKLALTRIQQDLVPGKITEHDNKSWRWRKLEKQLKDLAIVEDKDGIRGVPINIPHKGDLLKRTLPFFLENGVDKEKLYSFRHIRYEIIITINALLRKGISRRQFRELEPRILILFKYLNDQGFNPSMASGTGMTPYYLATYFETVYHFRRILASDEPLFESITNFLGRSGLDIFKPVAVGENSRVNMDSFQSIGSKYLFATLAAKTPQQQVRNLQFLSSQINQMILTDNAPNGFKVDGCGYHHNMNYFSYMKGAIGCITPVVFACRNSSFAISKAAYERLKKATLNGCFYSNFGWLPLVLQGRSPFAPYFNYSYCKTGRLPQMLKELALSSPDFGVDRQLAQAYVTINPKDTDFAEKYNLQSKLPEGNLVLPYGGIAVQRRNNWLALAAGYGKYFKGVEIYAAANRFGRYLANGSLDILGDGGLWASGNSVDGWDWNRINGATVIYYPLAQLRAQRPEPHIRTRYGFFGGISWRGTNGCFAMQLDGIGSDYPNVTLCGKKTYFFINDRIYAMGSNLKSNDKKHPLQTNLYQKSLKAKNNPTYVDGKEITAFPVADQALDAKQSHYLLDSVGNGYYLPSGQTVYIARKLQKSRDATDGLVKKRYGVVLKPENQGDFATAWIDHGVKAENGAYEYVVMPYCGKDKLAKFASLVKSGKAYEILQKDASAHIIHDLIDDFYAGVFFKEGKVEKLPHVAEVGRNCMIMHKKRTERSFLGLSSQTRLEIAVGDPDVNRRNATGNNEYGWRKSISKPFKVTFTGIWKLDKPVDGVKILSSDREKTVIEFGCIDGKTFNFSLIK